MSAHPVPLRQQVEERIATLRAEDSGIRRHEREIARELDIIRRAEGLLRLARLALRRREEWLRDEAVIQIRAELGITTIPGFATRKESAAAQRRAFAERQRATAAAARTALSTPPAPADAPAPAP